MSTTAEKIHELETKIATETARVSDDLADERAQLEQLRTQHAAEQHAEHQRQAGRRKAWARGYLATRYADDAGEARKAETKARRDFEAVLAEAPWVQSLLAWQAARNAVTAVEHRANLARVELGQPERSTPLDNNVLPMLGGQVSFDPLGQLLHRMAANIPTADPREEVDTLVAGTEPIADTPGPDKASRNADPLGWLGRLGERLDVVTATDEAGNEVTTHRLASTGEWVQTRGGQVTATSWTQPQQQGQPTNPIDGRG